MNQQVMNYLLTRIVINDYTMDLDNFNADNAKKTITHEFGHALSLGHTDDSNAIMTQGKMTITTPQTIDKDHLKNKWGN